MSSVQFMQRLAALVPRPRLIRFGVGVNSMREVSGTKPRRPETAHPERPLPEAPPSMGAIHDGRSVALAEDPRLDSRLISPRPRLASRDPEGLHGGLGTAPMGSGSKRLVDEIPGGGERCPFGSGVRVSRGAANGVRGDSPI
jgi:hypothetical protein